jgi:hypothetical protein
LTWPIGWLVILAVSSIVPAFVIRHSPAGMMSDPAP